MAIAAFERTLVTPGSRFDAYLSGQKEALSEAEKRGLGLYIGKASCTLCHNGANLTDNRFHNIGVPQVGPLAKDAGRFEVTHRAGDTGAFKTPTLRNLALTAPYMHNGAFASLEEVVAFYNRGGDKASHKSELMEPLNLSAAEQADLVAFLKALTGDLPRVDPPLLPPDS
jgi:cytochrome c peroxidase